MGYRHVNLTAERYRKRRRSRWLSYVVPLGAALGLAVIAGAIFAASMFFGGR